MGPRGRSLAAGFGTPGEDWAILGAISTGVLGLAGWVQWRRCRALSAPGCCACSSSRDHAEDALRRENRRGGDEPALGQNLKARPPPEGDPSTASSVPLYNLLQAPTALPQGNINSIAPSTLNFTRGVPGWVGGSPGMLGGCADLWLLLERWPILLWSPPSEHEVVL